MSRTRRVAGALAGLLAATVAFTAPAGALAGVLAAPVAFTAPAGALTPPPAPLVEAAPEGWPDPEVGQDTAAHLLLDVPTGQVLAAHAADERRPVASLVKVLTALSTLARTSLDEQVTVGAEVLEVPGSGVGLAPGDTWTVGELLAAVLARSGNEAAEALAVHVAGDAEAFLTLMERDAAALGVEGLELYSVSGLDDRSRLSASDLAVLARAALANDELAGILAARSVELPGLGTVENRNELLAVYPGATGVKTGFTAAAGNGLIASARRDGRHLLAVVLDAGEDPARFSVAARLLDHGFEEYADHVVAGRLRYSLGGGEVTFTRRELAVSTPVGEPPRLAWPVVVRPPERLTVAVAAGGARLGELETSRGGGRPAASSPSGALGTAIADGVYAGLRAAVREDTSGSLVRSSQGDGS